MSPCTATDALFRKNASKFDEKPASVGVPRLDPYHKLLSRFYEHLVLLSLLGKSRGNHRQHIPDLNPSQNNRRQYLRHLARICDYDRGGSTVTAIGVQELEACYIFWVASNENENKIRQFLENSLAFLKDLGADLDKQDELKVQKFVASCINFSQKRVNKDKRLLFKAVQTILSFLQHQDQEKVHRLVQWLKAILEINNNLDLCLFAFDNRHSRHLQVLRSFSCQNAAQTPYQQYQGPFMSAWHYFGRLAGHYRAPLYLCQNASHMSDLLSTYDVRAVDGMSSVPPPAPDNHTNLDGILTRLSERDSADREWLESGLRQWSALISTSGPRYESGFDKFEKCYQQLKPKVHAEVQMLHHFFDNGFQFSHNDRYVACSKSACYCCELYFQYHPARMVIPEGHQNVWTDWGPPIIQNFSKVDQASKAQTRLLNHIIAEMGGQIKSQISKQRNLGPRHPDSTTDITGIFSLREASSFSNVQIARMSPSSHSVRARGPNGSGLLSPDIQREQTFEMDDDSEDGGVSVH